MGGTTYLDSDVVAVLVSKAHGHIQWCIAFGAGIGDRSEFDWLGTWAAVASNRGWFG